MAVTDNSRGPRSDAARNRQVLVRAATAAVHREGPGVPMATIAADAGVGIGTLYRHFHTREELLSYLTHASFEQVLANATAAESNGATAAEALRHFIEAAISQRNQLVLPLHGGPATLTPAAQQARSEVHAAIAVLLARGKRDGVIRADVTPIDIVIFGAMLAQPLPTMTDWDGTARRYAGFFVAGLRPGTGSAPG